MSCTDSDNEPVCTPRQKCLRSNMSKYKSPVVASETESDSTEVYETPAHGETEAPATGSPHGHDELRPKGYTPQQPIIGQDAGGRRSGRLYERSHRGFHMPSRHEIMKSIPSNKTPEKMNNLTPKKLVGKFSRINNRYNQDDMDPCSSGSEMEDFICPDQQLEGSHSSQQSNSSSESSQSSRKKKKKIRKRQRSVKEDTSDSDVSDSGHEEEAKPSKVALRSRWKRSLFDNRLKEQAAPAEIALPSTQRRRSALLESSSGSEAGTSGSAGNPDQAGTDCNDNNSTVAVTEDGNNNDVHKEEATVDNGSLDTLKKPQSPASVLPSTVSACDQKDGVCIQATDMPHGAASPKADSNQAIDNANTDSDSDCDINASFRLARQRSRQGNPVDDGSGPGTPHGVQPCLRLTGSDFTSEESSAHSDVDELFSPCRKPSSRVEIMRQKRQLRHKRLEMCGFKKQPNLKL